MECRRCKYASDTYAQGLRGGAVLMFDLELASSICSDGRQPVRVAPYALVPLLEHRAIDEAHTEHVDESDPGMLAHIPKKLRERLTELPEAILIDGGHRATKSLRRHLPYTAYHLSEDETLLLIKRSNNALLSNIGFDP